MRDATDILYLTEREAPTEAGLYWARSRYPGFGIAPTTMFIPVHVTGTSGARCVEVIGLSRMFELADFTWYGPLPEVRIGSAP